MKSVLLALAALLPLPDVGDPPPVLSVDARVKDGVATIIATTPVKSVTWIDKDDGLANVVDPDLLKDSKIRVVTGKPRLYRVVAVVSTENKIEWKEVSFTIGTPEPPLPPPAPPAPVDDLGKKFRDAYTADLSPNKRGQLVALRSVYEAMIVMAKDKDVATSAALLKVLEKTKAGMMADGVLMDLRRLVAAEVAAAFGTPNDQPLDRERASALFSRILAALPTP